MKHKTSLEKIAGCLFAVLLALVSIQAQAATDKVDREFNHRNSGYPLTGIHTTTPCESCHIGGVFRGTPRACDGCHAVGTRVSATPKSTKHIVTDAACESCHFNTSTFFGARYNHGTAVRGECTNCHNGRIVEGTPRNHPVTSVGLPCDNCHRSTAWIPASWNHTDTGSDCIACHIGSPSGRTYTTSTARHNVYTSLNILTPCRECHTNYYTFYSYRYTHNGAATACGNCHANAAYANGVTQAVSAIHASATAVFITDCQSCHLSKATFVGARYGHNDAAYATKMAANSCTGCHDGTHAGIRGIPSSHSGALPALGNPSCLSCHSVTVWGTRMNHAIIGAVPCKQCHDSGLNTGSYFTGMDKKSNGHKGYNQTTQDCISCHANQYNRWNHP